MRFPSRTAYPRGSYDCQTSSAARTQDAHIGTISCIAVSVTWTTSQAPCIRPRSSTHGLFHPSTAHTSVSVGSREAGERGKEVHLGPGKDGRHRTNDTKNKKTHQRNKRQKRNKEEKDQRNKLGRRQRKEGGKYKKKRRRYK